jgi:hypothetical protein
MALIVGTLVAALSGMVVLIFAARRRQAEPELAFAAAAITAGSVTTAVAESPVARPPVVPYVDPAEADIPRWRRPSEKAARMASPITSPTAARRAPLVFSAPPAIDAERYVVRYDVVSLLSEPDEVFGRHVVELDTGDEVETIAHHSAWLQIRTPTGVAGWLPRMAVEPYVVEDDRPLTAAAADPVAMPPEDDEPDGSQLDEMLAAIVAQRARIAQAEAEAAKAQAEAAMAEAAAAKAQAVETTVDATSGAGLHPDKAATETSTAAPPQPARSPRTSTSRAKRPTAPNRAPVRGPAVSDLS